LFKVFLEEGLSVHYAEILKRFPGLVFDRGHHTGRQVDPAINLSTVGTTTGRFGIGNTEGFNQGEFFAVGRFWVQEDFMQEHGAQVALTCFSNP